MDVEVIREFLANLATDIGYIGVIGTFVYQIAWKPIVKKFEDNEEQHRRKMEEIAAEQNEPINKVLRALEESSKEHSETDRKLTKIADDNKIILQQHEKAIEQNKKDIKSIDERLVIVENKDGTKEISYREKYEGENS